MIFRAPEASIELPEVSLTSLLLARAAAHGDRPALIEAPSGRTLTHRQWAAAVRRVATGLAARGLRPSEVVAVYAPNLLEYSVALHATALAGGVVTPVNPLDTAKDLSRQLRDARARYLFTVPELLGAARQAGNELGLREVFLFGEAAGATAFAALLDSPEAPPVVPLAPRQDVALLPYSSGTTGLPKGVMLTHSNLVANVLQSAVALGVESNDIMLGALPFFHAYGMTVAMNLALYVGAPLVVLASAETEPILDALERYGVTFAPVVPPLVLGLASHPAVESYRLGALQTVLSGGAPLEGNVAMAASARIGCRVVQGYGLTETSPVTHATRRGGDRFRVTSIGPPVPNTEAKVADLATGAALPPHREGEIVVRGPQVMKGYLDQPAATAAMIDGEGWLRTGDVGYADGDGNFFVVDHVKELIKHKGLQVAPAELEAVLLSHPAVADAAVVPLADPEAGQVPKAFVVLSGPVTPEQLMGYVAERVAPYKELRSVELADQIPRSPAGKVLRRLLVERAPGGPVAPGS